MSDDHQEALTRARVDIATLAAQGIAQGREIAELKALVYTLVGKVDGVAGTLTEARGGWRMLMLLGGVSASFGAGVVWVIQHFSGIPK